MIRRFIRTYERYIFLLLVSIMFLIMLVLFYNFPLVFILISIYVVLYNRYVG